MYGVLIFFHLLVSAVLVLVGARLSRTTQAPRPTPAQSTPAQPAQPEPGPLGD